VWSQLRPHHQGRTRDLSAGKAWNERSPGRCSIYQPLAYTAPVLAFRETSLFTRRLSERLTDAEYLQLQTALILQRSSETSFRILVGFASFGGVKRDVEKASAVVFVSSATGMRQVRDLLLHIYSKTEAG
jgi:hypothetical protein